MTVGSQFQLRSPTTRGSDDASNSMIEMHGCRIKARDSQPHAPYQPLYLIFGFTAALAFTVSCAITLTTTFLLAFVFYLTSMLAYTCTRNIYSWAYIILQYIYKYIHAQIYIYIVHSYLQVHLHQRVHLPEEYTYICTQIHLLIITLPVKPYT